MNNEPLLFFQTCFFFKLACRSTSWCKINCFKPWLLPTWCSGYIAYIENWKFKWSLKGLKYIPVQIQDLIKICCQPLINTIRLDFDRWDRLLLLSLWGKYTIMTMNILPHLISICKSHTNRNPQAKLCWNK